MSYDKEKGITPQTIEEKMEDFRQAHNLYWNTNLSETEFGASNWYKIYYIMAQEAINNEVLASQIFHFYATFIQDKNLWINRPETTFKALINAFVRSDVLGVDVGIRQNDLSQAGEMAIAVDSTPQDFSQIQKEEFCRILTEHSVGQYSYMGTDSYWYKLPNGQLWEYKWFYATKRNICVRIKIFVAGNTGIAPQSIEELKDLFLENLLKTNTMGVNYEPDRLINTIMLPWALFMVYEYKDAPTDVTWIEEGIVVDFNQTIEVDRQNLEIIIT